MFLNQEARRRWENKQFKSRREYFRSYNRQPHRQAYLKAYGQVRQLVAKYNSLYRDTRKGDRHQLTCQTRYQLAILKKELNQRGWIETKNQESLSSSPFLIFNVALVDKKSPQTPYSYKSMFFERTREGLSREQKQEAYQFAYLVRKEGKELSEFLFKKPLLFRKRLVEIEKTSQAVSQHWTKRDIVQTINQIPQVRGWQLSTCWEKQDLSALLFQHQEAGGKNKLVLDFDHYKYEVSKSGGRKLHLNIDELPNKSKLWWKGLVVGDILGKGSQTTLPISKGRRIEFSKWSWIGVRLPRIELNGWEKDLAKFSLRGGDKGVGMRRGFSRVGKEESNFLSTNATPRKKLSYRGFKTVKPLKIFTPQPVKKLSSMGGSRESIYYQVPYLDSSEQRGSFLVDGGWREREFRRITSSSSFQLCLRVGERCDFLMRVS